MKKLVLTFLSLLVLTNAANAGWFENAVDYAKETIESNEHTGDPSSEACFEKNRVKHCMGLGNRYMREYKEYKEDCRKYRIWCDGKEKALAAWAKACDLGEPNGCIKVAHHVDDDELEKYYYEKACQLDSREGCRKK